MAVCVQMSMESILPKPALYPTLKYGNLLQPFLKDEDTWFCFCCSLLFLKPRPPWKGRWQENSPLRAATAPPCVGVSAPLGGKS